MSNTKRNTSVDLIKIIACYFVMGLHTNPVVSPISANVNVTIVICFLFKLGVPMFLMSAGFFMFRKIPIIKRYKNYAIKLLLPAFIVAVVTTWLYPYTIGRASIVQALRPEGGLFKELFNSILHWNSGNLPNAVSHMWYMMTYTKIVLLAPLLAFVCGPEKEQRAGRYLLYTILILNGINVDLLVAFGNGLPFDVISPIETYFLFPLIGYELFDKLDTIKSKKHISIIVGLSMMIISYIIMGVFLAPEYADGDILNALSHHHLPTVICCTGFMLILLALPDTKGKMAGIFSYIGARTYLMYLIHWPFAQKSITRGLLDAIQEKIFGTSVIGTVFFTILIPAALFVVSLIVATGIHELYEKIKRIIRKKENAEC